MLNVQRINGHAVENDVQESDIGKRYHHAIRQFVGPGREWSYDALARATKLERRMLEAYNRGENVPSLAKHYRIAPVLGHEFLTEIYSPLGYVVTPVDSDSTAVTHFELIQDLTSLLNLFTHACNEQGRFNHTKRREIDSNLLRLVGKLMAFHRAGTAH